MISLQCFQKFENRKIRNSLLGPNSSILNAKFDIIYQYFPKFWEKLLKTNNAKSFKSTLGASTYTTILITRALEGGIFCPTSFLRITVTRRRAAPPNLAYLRTIQEHTLYVNFDFLGQKVRSPGQVKFRCAPRERLQTSTSRCGHSCSPNDLKL